MADNNNPNQVIVEIVLDDGSIQKGFAKFTSASKQAADESKKNIKTIGDVLNGDIAGEFKKAVMGVPVQFAGALTGITAAIGVAAVVIKKGFDLTLEGEKLKAVQAQFENFAHQSGISAQALEDGLVRSAKGLISTDDLLKIATKSMVELGASASQLPQVLEITRKATVALGGSLEERFAAVTTAIETGQTRLLRSQGIIIDQDKAFKEYAKTLGVAAGSLSKAQEQQAILNAFLTQAGEKFKDVKTGITPTNFAVKQISVSLKEMHENFALFVNSEFGSAFASVATAISHMLKEIVELKKYKSPLQEQTNSAADLRVAIIQTEATIKSLKEQLSGLGKSYDSAFDATIIKNKLDTQVSLLNSLQLKFKETGTSVLQTAQDVEKAKAEIAQKSAKDPGLTDEQVKAQRDRINEISQLQIKSRQDQLAAEIAQLPLINDFEMQKTAVIEANDAQRLINQNQFELDLQAIKDKYSAEKGFTEEQRLAASDALNLSYNAKRLTAETDLQTKLAAIEKAKKAQEEKIQKERLQGLSTFFGGLASLTNSGSKELFEIGKAGAIAQATVDGYLAIQNALANVPYPFNLAAAAGIAVSTASNIAAITSSSFGGGGSVSANIPSTNVGSDLNPSEITPKDAIERKPNEGLVVNVNGDILGDEASGKRLVDLMNSAFDASGVSLRQGLV